MVSNRMILAIGPEQVESMKYLASSGAALCINSMDTDIITTELKSKMMDAEYRRNLAEISKKVASENHDVLKIQADLYKDLCELT